MTIKLAPWQSVTFPEKVETIDASLVVMPITKLSGTLVSSATSSMVSCGRSWYRMAASIACKAPATAQGRTAVVVAMAGADPSRLCSEQAKAEACAGQPGGRSEGLFHPGGATLPGGQGGKMIHRQTP